MSSGDVDVDGASVGGDASSSSSSLAAPSSGVGAAPVDPLLLAQLQQHLAHVAPHMMQGNAAIFNQHLDTKETEVRNTAGERQRRPEQRLTLYLA
jgi:hypothetical protein